MCSSSHVANILLASHKENRPLFKESLTLIKI